MDEVVTYVSHWLVSVSRDLVEPRADTRGMAAGTVMNQRRATNKLYIMSDSPLGPGQLRDI